MRTLNERQRNALATIAEARGKNGKFYADLGHLAVTLSSLYWRGFIETDDAGIIGRSIYAARWTITQAGRAALKEPRR